MRRDSRAQYELLIKTHTEVTFEEATLTRTGERILAVKHPDGFPLGYFYKSQEGFWYFHSENNAVFDQEAMFKIARKLVDLNLQDRGVEKIHGRR